MSKMFFFIIISYILSIPARANINLEIEDIAQGRGEIVVLVYNQQQDFLQESKAFRSYTAQMVKGKAKIQLKKLPEGEYAISVFHDQNYDKRLTKNFLGIPLEGFGFSRNPKVRLGPPDYRDCVIRYSGETIKEKISLTYL
jgi:uncharacterized protein (DUF2141 family)